MFNILLTIFIALLPPSIQTEKARWSPYYVNSNPDKVADTWLIPFKAENRKSFSSMKVISVFGAARDSYLKGHIHTAIDIEPAAKTSQTAIYPMANGVVCSVHLADPQLTIVVKHKLADGKFMFTSYKHLTEAYVTVGQQVTADTKIARLFTAKETKKFGGNYDHLHLEVRKKFDDFGCASWLTMTKAELNERFYEPAAFIKSRLR